MAGVARHRRVTEARRKERQLILKAIRYRRDVNGSELSPVAALRELFIGKSILFASTRIVYRVVNSTPGVTRHVIDDISKRPRSYPNRRCSSWRAGSPCHRGLRTCTGTARRMRRMVAKHGGGPAADDGPANTPLAPGMLFAVYRGN